MYLSIKNLNFSVQKNHKQSQETNNQSGKGILLQMLDKG